MSNRRKEALEIINIYYQPDFNYDFKVDIDKADDDRLWRYAAECKLRAITNKQ